MDGASPFNESAGELKALVVEGAGGRLDAWIAAALAPDYSRSRIKVLVKDGHVSVNGTPSTEPNRKLHDGDRIEIMLPEAEDPVPQGEDIPLEVLYEDSDIIVINKPPGLVVHPAAGNWTVELAWIEKDAGLRSVEFHRARKNDCVICGEIRAGESKANRFHGRF